MTLIIYTLINLEKNIDIKKLTAPCGIDCFNCQVFESVITEETKERMSNLLHVPKEEISCKGCRIQDGYKMFVKECKTLNCVKEKNLDFCHQCDVFPCDKYTPSSDRADRFPHNMKVYNLCRIKLIGLEEWSKEVLMIRKKYYNGEFVPSTGTVL